jgi:hypothetical protein
MNEAEKFRANRFKGSPESTVTQLSCRKLEMGSDLQQYVASGLARDVPRNFAYPCSTWV